MAAVWFIVTIPTQINDQKHCNFLEQNATIFANQTEFSKSIEKVDRADVIKGTNAENSTAQLFEDGTNAAIDSCTNTNDNEPPTIEKVLKITLDKLDVKHAVWNVSENGQYLQVNCFSLLWWLVVIVVPIANSLMFDLGSKVFNRIIDIALKVIFSTGRSECEKVLQVLASQGIGSRPYTTLSVLPCIVHYNGETKEIAYDSNSDFDCDTDSEDISSLKTGSKFLQSVKSRLTVAQVVDGVRNSAVLTFDFIMFVLLAGMLAALGLVENSSVILVASMLVSPMMGPILAGTFGRVIRDEALQKLGVRNELIGLGLCLSFGFFFGIIYGSSEHWGDGFWITNEMAARGQLRSLWVGVLIALPSGAGVALSVLGGNAGSLVGVAISASLLPPVVNAGLLWAVALTKYLNSLIYESVDYLSYPDSYVPSYSNNTAIEACALGAVSLSLTIVNIICIFIMGVIVLKVKEVAPHTTFNNTKRFWQHDIKAMRDYNRTLTGAEAKITSARIMEELREKDCVDLNKDSDSDMRTSRLHKIMEDISMDPVYRTVRTMSSFPTSELISHQTWHPEALKKNHQVFKEELQLQKRRGKHNFQRSLSNPPNNLETVIHFYDDGNGQRKHPTPSAPTNESVLLTPVSPTRKLWNFQFQKPSVLNRFTVTRTEEDPQHPTTT